MNIKQSSEYYSIRVRKEIMNDKVYYDRDHRKKSWFYLVLDTSDPKLNPTENQNN